MSALQSAVAVTGDISGMERLGRLITTHVPDKPVDGDRLRDMMALAKLPAELVPTNRPEVKDFQIACSSVSARRAGKDAKGEYVDVTRVKADTDECVYQITRGVKDEANRVIDHEKEMRIVYKHGRRAMGNDPIVVEHLSNSGDASLRLIEQRVREHFAAHRGLIPGQNVRVILREVFARCHATRWATNASVWFVPEQHAQTVEAMERVLKAVCGSDVDFTQVQLCRAGNMDVLESKVASHVRTDVSKLMKENAERLSSGDKVAQRTFESARAERIKLDAYAKKMIDVVGSELGAVQESLRMLDEQLLEMWGRVE